MPNLQSLLDELRNGGPEQRRDAAVALMKVGDPEAVEPLIHTLMYDPDADTKVKAAVALGRMGNLKAFTPLMIVIEREDMPAVVRSAAVYAMGNLRDRRALPTIIDCLKDEAREVRQAAIYVCGLIPGSEMQAHLLEALQDEDVRVQMMAVQVLGKRREAAAVPALLHLLHSTPYGGMQESIIQALRDINDPAAVEPLLGILRGHESAPIRQKAAQALGSLGDARAVPGLRAAMRDEDARVQEAASAALQVEVMQAAIRLTPMPRLILQSGEQAGAEIPIFMESITIGRAVEDAQWEVRLPDPAVSRPHARIAQQEGGWYIEDLGSGNGTLLNGYQLSEASWLYDGDLLQIGETQLLFRWQLPAESPRPSDEQSATL